MSKLYTVKVFDGNTLVLSRTIEGGMIDPLTGPALIQVQSGQVIELIDLESSLGPKRVLVRRVGDDLEITFEDESAEVHEGQTSPDVVLIDFYSEAGPATLLGLSEDGTLYSYLPADGMEGAFGQSLADSNPMMLNTSDDSDSNPLDGIVWFLGATAFNATLMAVTNDRESKPKDPAPPAPNSATSIDDIKDSSDTSVAKASATKDTQLTVHGRYDLDLEADEVVMVYRNGVKVGTAVVDESTRTWVLSDDLSGETDGNYSYTARIENTQTGLAGQNSNPYQIELLATPPESNATINNIIDEMPPQVGNVEDGEATNTRNPKLEGTLDKALDADKGECLNIYREDGNGNIVLVGTAVVTGTNWTFTDDLSTVGDGTYTYRAWSKTRRVAKVRNGTNTKSRLIRFRHRLASSPEKRVRARLRMIFTRMKCRRRFRVP